MINRRAFLAATAGSALAPAANGKPNILVIVADDLGYADIGVNGCRDVPTPNIDSIARNGVRFTNGYVSCPVCSPTRAGLMTGRYQQRFGHEFNPGPAARAADEFGLPRSEATLAERLKALGYATGMVGKWHLGYREGARPTERGFDEFFGFLGGAHSYLNAKADPANLILRGTEPVDEKEYLTDAFAREAAAFVDRNSRKPFFLYLTFNAVHAPMEAIDPYLSRFASIAADRRRTLAGMLSALDDGVGRVLARLREARIENDTLIVFVSDNGGPTQVNTSRNTPLRGYKGQVLEGGIRVPFLMQWPSRLPKGKVFDHPVIALDIHPTAVAAAGGTPASGLDGVDLVPFLKGATKNAPHASLYWRFSPQRAIRKGDWKLVDHSGATELYNLASDASESNDLAMTNPGKVKELEADYQAWNSQLQAPRWRTQRSAPRRRKKA
jgi:arylsulfatase A-like enzyme